MSGATSVRQASHGRGDDSLTNLIALAHLAVWSEEGRVAQEQQQQEQQRYPPSSASSSHSSSRTASPAAATAIAATVTASSPAARVGAAPAPAPPTSRRPAKKRAVPANFDRVVTDAAAVAIAEEPPSRPVGSDRRRQTIDTSKPSSSSSSSSLKLKRPAKQSKSSSSGSNKKKSRGSSSSNTSFKMKANQPSFPVILMAIMSATQNGEYISFLSDGQSFIIVHPGVLARNVLPIHFEENVPTYDQFLNLLAIWGFEIIKDPQYPHVNVYKHPMFRKGEWETCLKMKLPDPSKQGDEVAAVKARARSLPGSPRQDSVAAMAVAEGNNVQPSTPRTARSVTPPGEMTNKSSNNGAIVTSPPSDLALLQRVSNQLGTTTAARSQTQQRHFSNLGPKFASDEENMMYRLLLQENMRVGGGRSNQGQMTEHLSPSLLAHQPPRDHRSAAGRTKMEGVFSVLSPTNAGASARMPTDQHCRANVDTMMPPPLLASGSFGHRRNISQQQQQAHQSGLPSDAEVQSATEEIVSAAIDALHQNDKVQLQQQQQRQTSPLTRSRRHTIDSLHGAANAANNNCHTSRLDAMTDLFLEQSLARIQKTNHAMQRQQQRRPAATAAAPFPSSFPRRVTDAMASNSSVGIGVAAAASAGLSRQEWALIASVGAEVEAHTNASLVAAALQAHRARQRQHQDMLGRM